MPENNSWWKESKDYHDKDSWWKKECVDCKGTGEIDNHFSFSRNNKCTTCNGKGLS